MGHNALFDVLSAGRVPLLGGKFRPTFRMVAGQSLAGFLPLADQTFVLEVDSKTSPCAEGIKRIADRSRKLDSTTAAMVAQLLGHATPVRELRSKPSSFNERAMLWRT
jgi:hypothetical protein